MPPSPPNSEVGDESLNSFYYPLFDDYSPLYESAIIPDSNLPPILSTNTLLQLSGTSSCHFSRSQKNQRYGDFLQRDKLRRLSDDLAFSSTPTFYHQKSNDKHKMQAKTRKHLRRQSGNFF